MTDFADIFRNRVKKSKDLRVKDEGGWDVGYPTGFTNFDFRNGSYYYGKKDGEPYKNYVLGLIDGSMNMLIGRSSSGKTTLALQMAGNIAKRFDNCVIYHDDLEGGATYLRRKETLGFTDEEMNSKYIYRNGGITIENFYTRVKEISEIKRENYDKLLYGTGCYDINGNEIMKLEPTIYIMDSLANLMPEKYADEDELSGQMAATQTAKSNKSLASRLLQILKPYNIILIFINHINDAVTTGVPKKAQLPFLKQDEALSGGKNIHYLQNNIIRVDDGSKLKETDSFQIDGNITLLSCVKSRTNKSGKPVPLIFNQATGFDNNLSLLRLLSDHKMINGAGAYLYIGDRSDHKFSNKTFLEKLSEDEELQDILIEESLKILMPMLSGEMDKEVRDLRNKVAGKFLDKLNNF